MQNMLEMLTLLKEQLANKTQEATEKQEQLVRTIATKDGALCVLEGGVEGGRLDFFLLEGGGWGSRVRAHVRACVSSCERIQKVLVLLLLREWSRWSCVSEQNNSRGCVRNPSIRR